MDIETHSALSEKAKIFLHSTGGLGQFIKKLNMEIISLNEQEAEASINVLGNLNPVGQMHTGAYLSLAETLAHLCANTYAFEFHKIAVSIDISAVHLKFVRDGVLYAKCKAIALNKNICIYEIKIAKNAIPVSSVRITLILQKRI